VSRRAALAVAAAVAGLVGVPAAPALSAPRYVQCDLPATRLVTTVPWAQQRLGLDRVWPLTRGSGVTVGVVDSGVDGRQPLLAGHVLPGLDVINGGGPADTDCAGHGTFVAGLIAGQRHIGVGFSGVAPGALILPVRQANTTQDGTPQSLAAGIRAAVDGGARVVNVSVTVAAPVPALAAAVRYALGRDVVLVAAAGNDFQQGDPVQYPAAYPGVIAVGAVGPDDRRADFSETHTNISVVAPGSDLIGPGAGGPWMVSGQRGTSFATAYVSGVAALIRAYHPGLSARQVKYRLEATADHPAAALPDPQLGYGEVNPYAAVADVLPEELGSTATPAAAPIPLPAAPIRLGTHPAHLALRLAAALGAGTLAVLTAATILPAGRRRRWRPGPARELPPSA
jgi:type VII secretion-associated serine protease mycosin